MHHHNNTHTFIDSLLQSQHQFMQAMADHRDQLSETMSSMAHSYLDTSIDRLKRFHDHVANDASGLKSDMLEATLKAAIDQHKHLKDRLTVHQHHANSHKERLRRLAMGVMATFGVMSGVKAADAFESGQGNGGANSSTSTTQEDIRSETASDLGSQENLQDFFLDDYAFMLAGDATALADESVETTSSSPYSKMMQLLERSSDAKLFDSVFTALTESKLSNENELKTIESKINDHPKLTTEEKKILVSLFNLNSPADIIKAADLLSNIRSEHTDKLIREAYNKKAAQLYTQAANHQDATKDDILDGGFGLSSLGEPYKKQAAELFVKAASQDGASRNHIKMAADGLKTLGEAFHDNAAELFELYANHNDANKYSIEYAASSLASLGSKYFGSKYFDRAVALYGLYSKVTDAIAVDILLAAQKLIDLGQTFPYQVRSAYKQQAAELFELYARHNEATPENIRDFANRLEKFGPDYHDRAAGLYALANQKEAEKRFEISLDFKQVSFSDELISQILKKAAALPAELNPKREGNKFEPQELGCAGTILQGIGDAPDAQMSALCVVFSRERAKALLETIVNGD